MHQKAPGAHGLQTLKRFRDPIDIVQDFPVDFGVKAGLIEKASKPGFHVVDIGVGI